MRQASLLLLLAAPLFDRHCTKNDGTSPATSATTTAPAPAPKSDGPLRIERLEGSEPPVFVLRGGQRGPDKLVFLHGMCGDGMGYAQSFQQSAAKRGTLVSPQADVPCDGSGARWSKDVAALDARIADAFRKLGHPDPIVDLIVIGYSQGATRAESLARAFPERYTRLVLMGGPYAAKAQGLETLRAAVAMAGDQDRLDLMKASARTLSAVGVPATFMLIPEAPHGSMGSQPEQTMDEMLTWLLEHQRPPATARSESSPKPPASTQ
jgi:pimeloyl-ACP methyl ester carboxylesterase